MAYCYDLTLEDEVRIWDSRTGVLPIELGLIVFSKSTGHFYVGVHGDKGKNDGKIWAVVGSNTKLYQRFVALKENRETHLSPPILRRLTIPSHDGAFIIGNNDDVYLETFSIQKEIYRSDYDSLSDYGIF